MVLVARTTSKLQELAVDLREEGVDVEILTADLTATDGLRSVEDRLRHARLPVDLLVNNAGMGQVGRFDRFDADETEQVIALNVLAPVRLVYAALPRLQVLHGGVLNVSSIGANQPVPHMAVYAASKAFLTSWGEAIHEELRRTSVHVTTLAPGFTRTNFAAEASADDAASRIPTVVWADPATVARIGVDGVAHGRAVVTPGPIYRAGATLSNLTPSSVSRRVIGTVMRYLD